MTDQEARAIKELVDGIYEQYGYDFRNYAQASIRRRILSRLAAEGMDTIEALQKRICHDVDCMERLLLGLTIHVTSMFRDPEFYHVFRDKVVPHLRTYPSVRIWHAGCSTGEEVYSMAILLQEEGLYQRCRIYATDLSETVIRQARTGIFKLSSMREYTENYLKAGGKRAFSEYYVAEHDGAILNLSLRDRIVFAPHNLVTDTSFNEFNVILCRNVMIYFDASLQRRVFTLLNNSLDKYGILCLGRKETIRFSPHESCYEVVDHFEKMYRRVN
jgi:chemotaxis protein methyltransferase CheR